MSASSHGVRFAAPLLALVGMQALTVCAAEGIDAAALQLQSGLQLQPGFESRHERLQGEPAVPVPGSAAIGQPELSQVGLRLWASRGRYALGVGVGAISYSVLAPAGGTEPARTLAQQVGPTVTVGWRVRLDDDAAIYADTSAVPRFGAGEGRYLSTRGGIEWKLSESRFGFDRGRLAMRLDSGYRMSLRVRHGGVAVMLRGQF